MFFISWIGAFSHGIIGGSLYFSVRRMENIASVTVLDVSVSDNADTCSNGKTRDYSPTYYYTCHIDSLHYGNIQDSIVDLKFTEPSLTAYDDSCNATISYWIITSYSGTEDRLAKGDKVLLCFDDFFQIIAARKEISGMDDFVVKHFEEIKWIDKNVCNGYNIAAIGATKHGEVCFLRYKYDSSIGDDVPVIYWYCDGVFRVFDTCVGTRLDGLDSDTVWLFKMKQRKIILRAKGKRHKVPCLNIQSANSDAG